MSLSPGVRLGSYEILVALGAGGMGEVYRARDPKLNRDVAIKVLLPAVADDPDRLARFSREAQVLASLNHPNIAHIYGLDRQEGQEGRDGMSFLIMELVEGEELAQRIARGAIPLDEVLPIARQIADALEAAHEQGVIHRDLKPANIKVRPDGTVKVLDFGLAKALDGPGGSGRSGGPGGLENSPTLSIHATQAGIILGTAAYMSPEQARGKSVDRRVDIWAFGCVMFEMLTGTRAFPGDDATDTIVSVVSKEPDWNALPAAVPAGIRRLLRRCLEKDPRRRLDSANAVRLEIDEAGAAPTTDSALASVTRGPLRPSVAPAIAAFIVGGLIVGAGMWSIARSSRDRSLAPVVRFAIHDTDKVIVSRAEGDMALSPDGQTLAYVGFSEGGTRIWLRPIDSLDARPLAGTEGAQVPSWSPDGRSLVFGADRKVKRLLVAGGTAEVVSPARVISNSRFAWGPDGTLLYTDSRGFWRVPAAGGTSVKVYPHDEGLLFDAPQFLPDGRHFLVAVRSPAEKSGTFVASLDDSSRVQVLPFSTPARYAMGHLLFVRDRMLYGQRFDLSRQQLTGEAMLLASGVAPMFAISNDGAVAVLPLGAFDQPETSQLVWMNRSGHVEERIDQAADTERPSLSPDGRRVAMALRRALWVLDLARGVLSRVIPDSGSGPVWAPDSQRLFFYRQNARDGKDLVFETSIETVGSETLVREPIGQHAHPTSVSPDGRYLIYEGEQDGYDIWVQGLTGVRKASVFLPSPNIETQGMVSPDGRWLAYTSDLSGRLEIYVQSFPQPGVRIQVSPNGGSSARWRRDGKELFYLTPNGTLTAVSVRGAPSVEFGTPTALFQFFNLTQRGIPSQTPPYDVTADGQRFIVSAVVRRTDPSINVLLNWPTLMKKD